MKDFVNEWIIENGSYKLVALFITLILWVSVLGRKEATVTKEIPLTFTTGQTQTITNASSWNVKFELSGSRRALRKFGAEKIEPINVDVSSSASGRLIVSVPEDSLRLPFGVKVQAVNPPSLVVDIEDIVKKKVPVVINWRESKENNGVILNATVEPSEITIEGGKSALLKVREVSTLEVSSRDAVQEGGKSFIRTRLKTIEMTGLVPIKEQEVVIKF